MPGDQGQWDLSHPRLPYLIAFALWIFAYLFQAYVQPNILVGLALGGAGWLLVMYASLLASPWLRKLSEERQRNISVLSTFLVSALWGVYLQQIPTSAATTAPVVSSHAAPTGTPLSPFSITSWAYFSTSGWQYSAMWFAFVPDRATTVPVNASVYVRVTNNTSQRLWIDTCVALALVKGKWIPLIPMLGGDSGVQFYYETPTGWGSGWAIPRNLDFTVVTEQPIAPEDEASGWVFFAYPSKLLPRVTSIKIELTDRTGVTEPSISVAPPLGTMHPFMVPPHAGTKPTDLRRDPTVFYCRLLSQC